MEVERRIFFPADRQQLSNPQQVLLHADVVVSGVLGEFLESHEAAQTSNSCHVF